MYSPANTSNPASPLPRLAALRGQSYRDQRLELGGVNPNSQPPDIVEWQNATEEGGSTTSDEPWVIKEDQTSVTESTVAEEMEEQKGSGVGGEDGGNGMMTDEERRRLLAIAEKAKMADIEK
jgi:hypothetical protein